MIWNNKEEITCTLFTNPWKFT